MKQPFLALITPLAGPVGPPDHQPPGIWGPSDPRPTNPIAGFDPIHGTFPPVNIGGTPPLTIWGPGDPRPTNPIAGFDPGSGQFPGGGGGGGGGGNYPSHPIHYPPGTSPGYPGWAPGDPNKPHPEYPIVIPPPNWQPPQEIQPPPPGETEPLPGNVPTNPIVVPEYVVIWYPGYGPIMVGKPEGDPPTPTTPPPSVTPPPA